MTVDLRKKSVSPTVPVVVSGRRGRFSLIAGQNLLKGATAERDTPIIASGSDHLPDCAACGSAAARYVRLQWRSHRHRKCSDKFQDEAQPFLGYALHRRPHQNDAVINSPACREPCFILSSAIRSGDPSLFIKTTSTVVKDRLTVYGLS